MVSQTGTMQTSDSEVKSQYQVVRADHYAGWGIWLHWVVYSVVGYLFYETTNTAVSLAVPAPWSLLAGFLGGILGMAIVALLQWLVLRRAIARLGWLGWTVLTVLGQLLGTIAVVLALVAPVMLGVLGDLPELLGAQTINTTLLLASGAIMGTVIGSAQWLVLVRHLPGAGWWVLACAVGGAVNKIIQATPFMSGLVGIILTRTTGWAVFAMITGLTLVWLSRRQRQHTQTQPISEGIPSGSAPAMSGPKEQG